MFPISKVGFEKQELSLGVTWNEAVSEGIRPRATAAAKGEIKAVLLSLSLPRNLKSLPVSWGCSWEGKMNINKSKDELEPTGTTGSNRTNWNPPLSLNKYTGT